MKLKGIISMFLLMLYAMGSIGGFGYAMYCKAYVIGSRSIGIGDYGISYRQTTIPGMDEMKRLGCGK